MAVWRWIVLTTEALDLVMQASPLRERHIPLKFHKAALSCLSWRAAVAAKLPGGDLMNKTLVHLLPPGSGKILASFFDVPSAIIHADQRGFERGFGIQDLRPHDDVGQIRDRPLLAAHSIREALLSHWVRMQFDRLLSGEIRFIPRDPALGLAVPSALFAQHALAASGADGWSAVMGVFHDPSPYPVPLKQHTIKPVPHAWLQHDSGMVMDLSRRVFQRSPVTVLLAGNDGAERFSMQRVITSKRSETVAASWLDESGPDLVSGLRKIDVGEAFRLDRALQGEQEMSI